ncbi:hypothetical protein Acr_17g0004100 [Actinidia rufa]|uniref:NB-ARC domain-containing protein n=1 Tax=Actinidia rufa TaxID=165716 RepID=A0A7J0G250_9ERIC|nr:hypothetical protein Acr_17g0004100 [Actinidia rufa]
MAKKMIGDIARHISGQDEKMQTLRKIFKTLSCQAADVKQIAEAEELRSGKKRKRVVDNWLGDVEMMENKVQKLEEIGESKIPSLLWGHRIDKLIGEIEKLHEEGRFQGGLLFDTCQTTAEPLLAPELTIQTSKRNLEEIFKYLMDDKVRCIGIHGMGGVGKTTLAVHIYNRLIQDFGTFGYNTYWVTVSQENSIAKCSGLPLAIITMGGSMREVNDIQEWRNVLKKLEELTMGQEYMANEVHPILEFSYSSLNDLKLKLCFLCCTLHPKDQEIERDELIGYFIAEGLIDEGKPWQAKFDEGHSMLKTLERCVKTHDLMRAMALKITKAGHPRFMVNAGVGLKDIPPEQEWTEDLDKVSLMGNGIEEIPFGHSPRLGESHCISASRLSASHIGPVEVQAEELERLRELKEIILWLSDIDSFKQFVKCLRQPRFWGQLDKYFLAVREGEYVDMIYGDDCDFYKVLILNGPYNVNGGEGEDGILLPYDLQLLRIGGCSFARGSACLYDDVFPSLCGNITLLKECELLDCDGIESIISSSTSSYSSTSLQSLEKLSLRDLPDFGSLFRSKFLGFVVIAPSCGTFSNLKNLSVSNCPKIKSLFTSILQLLFRNLEVIISWVCAQIKEIIETVTEDGLEISFFRNHDDNNHDIPLITLPKLKELELVDLPELKSIFEGIMVCESMEEITVHECTKLRRLPFSLPLVNGQLSAPTTLKKLYIDRESWRSLEWDHPNAKEALRPYLVSNWI